MRLYYYGDVDWRLEQLEKQTAHYRNIVERVARGIKLETYESGRDIYVMVRTTFENRNGKTRCHDQLIGVCGILHPHYNKRDLDVLFFLSR